MNLKLGRVLAGSLLAALSACHQDNSSPLRIEDLPPSLHHRYVGVDGKLLLQVYPKDDVWERTNQEKFVTELRTIDPNVTGAPVQFYEYETLMLNSYIQAARYSLVPAGGG